MAGKLENKVAIVTGGTSAVGRAVSSLFAGEGAKVVVAGTSSEEGDAVVAHILAQGGEAIYVEADIGSNEDADNLVAKAVETYGGIDILINNAGDLGSGTMADISLNEWNKAWAVNVTGPLYLSKAAASSMLERGRGSIVYISSVAGGQSASDESDGTEGSDGGRGYNGWGGTGMGSGSWGGMYGGMGMGMGGMYGQMMNASRGLTSSIANLSDTITKEYGPAIRSKTIVPGVDVALTREPEDIAAACLAFVAD